VNRHTVHHLWDTIKAILTTKPRPWDIWPEDNPYGTPDDYCRHVTGHSWETLISVVVEFAGGDSVDAEFSDNIGVNEVSVRKMQTLLAEAQAKNRKQGKHHPSNGKVSGGGNNAEYLLRRLARERPDLLTAFEQGRFKSVRAAAKEAGFIKEQTPLEIILRHLPKLTDAELDTLLSKISHARREAA
jgi:hypothetical protein